MPPTLSFLTLFYYLEIKGFDFNSATAPPLWSGIHLADHTRVMAHNFGRAAASARLISTLRGSRKSSMESSTVPSPARDERSCLATLEGSSIEGNGPHNPCEDLRVMEANKDGVPEDLAGARWGGAPAEDAIQISGQFIIRWKFYYWEHDNFIIVHIVFYWKRIATYNVEKIFFVFINMVVLCLSR